MIYARIALGVAFLSAVADRFGWWGAPGARNVAWGDFRHFLAYTGKVNPYLSASLVPALGWFVTTCEIVLGVALTGVALAVGHQAFEKILVHHKLLQMTVILAACGLCFWGLLQFAQGRGAMVDRVTAPPARSPPLFAPRSSLTRCAILAMGSRAYSRRVRRATGLLP